MTSATEGESIESRVIGLLAQMVAIPTVSENPNLAILTWLEQRAIAVGATVSVVMGPEGRGNLLATIGPSGPGGVMFAGHTDVVPPGSGWSSDPWELTPLDGGARWAGRGSADMKGFFAAVLVALEGRNPHDLVAPIHIVASYDEEIGCKGVREILPLLQADPQITPRLVVIGEPTMMRPRHSHLGKQVFRVTVKAVSAHSSRAALEPSAISVAARLIGVLDAIQASCPTPENGDAPTFTVNCGTITGGTQTNVIAEYCEFVFEVRHDADNSPNEILAPFFSVVERERDLLQRVGGGIDAVETNRYPALSTSTTDPALRVAVRVADNGPSVNLGFGTEGGLYAEALGVPVVICGPGDIAVAHKPNEYVSSEQLLRCVQFTSALIDQLCATR